MPLLDKVKSMKEQGLIDEQITQQLKEQGHSPLNINQALEQSKIKAAISQNNQIMQQQSKEEPAIQPTEEEYSEEMEPSLISQEQPIQQYEQQEAGEAETPEYIYPTPQYAEQQYSEYQPYQYQESAETATEIAEQIAEEKISKLKRELGNIQELRMSTERRIKSISERLRRIEDIIDKLQATIIGKIGSYGQTAEDIKKEMRLMQESFSKALPSLAEKRTSKTRAKSEKKKAGIEHYLKR